jgi:hypothetical protein
MKKILIVGALSVAITACGGDKPAADPSSVTSTTATPDPGATSPTTPAAPAAATSTTATPADTATTPPSATTAAAPAAPDTTSANAEPCPTREATGKDLASCKSDCKKLDDKAPAGSKCIPPRTACLTSCDQKFKKK